MKYNIKGKNVEITEAINEYIQHRVDILSKYFLINSDTYVNILLKVYGDKQKIEVTIPTKYGVLRAESTDKDLYNAIDDVVSKLQSQIRRHKTKMKKQRTSKEKLGHAINFEVLPDLLDNEEENIIRVKSITPEAKDIETAILEMEMLNHSFYIYRDIETENIHLIYRRHDGGYGIIETNWLNFIKIYYTFLKKGTVSRSED